MYVKQKHIDTEMQNSFRAIHYCMYEIQKHRDPEMGNSVWAGVTWSRCGAVVAPSLTEYTIIHQSPLITDRFIPKHCIIDESVLCIQVYYALARPVVGNREVQSIITQLGELHLQLWRQNLLILEKFFNPNWKRKKFLSFWKETADFAEIYEHLKLRVTE